MTDIRTLEPAPLWGHFADLNAVPRPSKDEGKAVALVQQFAARLGLEAHTDAVGNVLVRKPASPGREGRPVVALQSHLDMVCQKNAGTDFNFATQGIRMAVEGDWVRAEGTTLGADNGIGVAAMLAVLEARDLVHPPLEALFTIDEETGMTGAKALQGGWLKAGTLLNLDTEDDRELTIGCAGGVDIVGTGTYAPEPSQARGYELTVKGLTGGHSGMEIHLGRANANKLMARLLDALPVRLASLDGGGLRNAIPREARAVVAAAQAPDVKELEARFQAEYRTTDPGLVVTCQEVSAPAEVLGVEFQKRLIRSLYAVPNGIYRLSPDVPGLVQTSNNLARVEVGNGKYQVATLGRGSVNSERHDVARAVACALELLGAEVEASGDYPGWAPRPEASIVRLMSSLYEKLFQETPLVNACHAGLECGILGANYPSMEMISFGPNIRGAHSPDERVQISSVAKFWRFLTETLACF